MGESVELVSRAVSPIDHRVVVAIMMRVPPAVEDASVQGEVVVDEVEVPARGR